MNIFKTISRSFLLATLLLTNGAAAMAEGNAAAGSAVSFDVNTRYSQLVINSRLNDFYANTKQIGFGAFDDKGNKTENEKGALSSLDYVSGLVAKAVLECVDYYKDSKTVNVKPWYYAVQYFGCKYDIANNGKVGKSFDDVNAVKLYFQLKDFAAAGTFADGANYSNATTVTTSNARITDALKGIAAADATYAIGGKNSGSSLADAKGGWFHKSSYVDQIWCDGLYMGPALLAMILNDKDCYNASIAISSNDWELIMKQFRISWQYLWDDKVQLLYHAFTANPGDNASKDWAGVTKGGGVYHSAEYWGRAMGWYFLALVDVLEQMEHAGMKDSNDYKTLHNYLNLLADGIAARQDSKSGCWYQLMGHDDSYVAKSYPSYSYTSSPVANYLEASCTAIFTAAYLKGQRLGMYTKDYSAVAQKAYKGMIEQFMKADGKGGVHIVGSCKSAGLGGSNYRTGSADYYLMGKDTQPTSYDPKSSSFYTEGKIFGAFILAATEYERAYMDGGHTSLAPVVPHAEPFLMGSIDMSRCYTLTGQKSPATYTGIIIADGRKMVK